MVQVKRRRVLAGAIGATAAAAIALTFGLWELAQRRSAAPSVVAVEKAILADALDDSPWISSGGDGPILWVVTSPDCSQCRVFEQKTLPALLNRGVQVRVIVVEPREAKAEPEAHVVAALARRRDWVSLHTWMTGGGDHTGAVLEAAATEGYLEWGRASYDRIARALERNGMAMAAPALFWRSGPEWRASVRPDARALGFLSDDLLGGS